MAFGTGFLGGTNGIWGSVLKTTGVTVSARIPRRQFPRCNWTEAALAFSFRYSCWMDSYVGLPMIGWMVGFEKLSEILSTDGILAVGLTWYLN